MPIFNAILAQTTTAAGATLPATLPASTFIPAPINATFSFLDELRLGNLISDNHLLNWLVLILAVLSGVAIGRVICYILGRIAKSLDAKGWRLQAELFRGISSPLNLAAFAIGLSIGQSQIVMSDPLHAINTSFITLLLLVALFWYAYNLVSVIETAILRLTHHTQTSLVGQLVPVIRKIIRIFIVIIGALFILQNVFHHNIGAWLAGLGIAGLAVSLSAQDSMRNLFGSLTILFDQPFSIGQEIKYANYDGTVEDIGFRSTRIRTADGSLVNIPNSAIVNNPVDNWGVRPTQRRFLQLHLPLNTPPDKIRRAIQIIKDLLESPDLRDPIHDARKNTDPPRVYFNDFNADSLNIQVFYWYRSMDGWAFSAHAQEFNLRLLEEFAKENITITAPTQSLTIQNPSATPPRTTSQ